jgi:hypothetical protein
MKDEEQSPMLIIGTDRPVRMIRVYATVARGDPTNRKGKKKKRKLQGKNFVVLRRSTTSDAISLSSDRMCMHPRLLIDIPNNGFGVLTALPIDFPLHPARRMSASCTNAMIQSFHQSQLDSYASN